MFPAGAQAGSRGSWGWGEDDSPPVDFAVWTLVEDGLRVTPFDVHDGGHGNFRAVGFDASSWTAWIVDLIQMHDGIGRLSGQMDQAISPELLLQGRTTGAAMMEPWRLYGSGDQPINAQLRDAWQRYRDLRHPWERPSGLATRGVLRLGGDLQRRLWQDLSALHQSLPSLAVYLVDYPKPVVQAIPPSSCLVSPHSDASAYPDQLRDAAKDLARSPQDE